MLSIKLWMLKMKMFCTLFLFLILYFLLYWYFAHILNKCTFKCFTLYFSGGSFFWILCSNGTLVRVNYSNLFSKQCKIILSLFYQVCFNIWDPSALKGNCCKCLCVFTETKQLEGRRNNNPAYYAVVITFVCIVSFTK